MSLYEREEEVDMEILTDCVQLGETPKAWRIQQNTQHGYRDTWIAKSISDWDPDEGVLSYESWAELDWVYHVIETKPF